MTDLNKKLKIEQLLENYSKRTNIPYYKVWVYFYDLFKNKYHRNIRSEANKSGYSTVNYAAAIGYLDEVYELALANLA